MITTIKEFYKYNQFAKYKWYHGSKHKFRHFTLNNEINNNLYGNSIDDHKLGIFFVNNLTMAKWFAGLIEFNDYEYVNTGNTGYVYECTMSIKNPFILNDHIYPIDEDDAGQTYFNFIDSYDSIDDLRNELISNNYDSILVHDVTTNYYEDGKYSILVILDPRNIKIIGTEN